MINKEDEPQDGDYADLNDENQQQDDKSTDQQQNDGENNEGVEEKKQSDDQDQQNQDQIQNENDLKSVYVQNVEYSCTNEDIQNHFKDCGTIIQITILKDKFTKSPKGGAYIQFEDLDCVELAKGLSDSTLKGRQIKVVAKRTNVPNFGGKRGRGGRGRGMMRGFGYPSPFMGRGGYVFQNYRRASRRFHPYQ